MVEIERIESTHRLDRLKPEWQALLAQSDADGLFLTWEWLRTWWCHLGGRRRLCLIAVRRAGELIALAPFAADAGPLARVLPRAGFLGTGAVGSDYLDVIVRRGAEPEAGEALAGELERCESPLELRQLCESSSLGRVLPRLAARGWTVEQRAADVCPFISLEGHSWDSYLATLGREHRYNLRRRLRQLEREGELRFERVADDERRGAALAALVALHRERWRGRGGSQAFGAAGVAAFHEEFSRLALARGWLRLFALRLDGRLAAGLYGFRYGRTFYYYQLGWDPSFATRSIGLVALGLAIRAAIEEGAAEFDLLHGSEAYKFQWASRTRALLRAEAYPPTARGRLLRAAVTGRRGGGRLARRLLGDSCADRLASLAAHALRERPLVATAR
ncbi:MAG: GNAT family N-acetyltransferase [Vicinamibacteria bacterium]